MFELINNHRELHNVDSLFNELIYYPLFVDTVNNNYSDFIIHRYFYKHHKINILKKIFIFLIARIINVLSFISDITKKIKLYLNKTIN